MNAALREELLRMAQADEAVREELLGAGHGDGKEADGRMPEVHRRNAARMRAILDQHGWPGRAMVGDEGADAAWAIVQHATEDRDLMTLALELLEAAVADGDAPEWHAAYLLDRMLMLDGKEQVYGSQYVQSDEGGEIVPWPIADEAHVDERRASLGLPPLAENTKLMREKYASAPPPKK